MDKAIAHIKTTNFNIIDMAHAIKAAFFEGFNSLKTPCNPYNSVEEAWEDSEAKKVHDKILSK